ncbi:ATP phosphoribosyltransferase regulatory subunit [Sulfurospirillum sp. 1612]|uniref:ATP phosphoribosyltransferase regulatory subunit n=1 Tax=Sulfurospirillum sp. 1612 TaxID=3094835 RepID=UPI002F944035
MIYEHEIPIGSKLYFGSSAKLKRDIESVASEMFIKNGFEEIVTPFLSYHQHGNIAEEELIRFSDGNNHILSLRADSTMDVVRLMSKRLGRSVNQDKWFYIQPVFKFPSQEINQIGAEYVGINDLSFGIEISSALFRHFSMSPLLQLCNITIPREIAKEFHLDIGLFERGEIEKLLAFNIPWLNKLVKAQSLAQIEEVITIAPKNIADELLKMKKLQEGISYEKIVFSPLFYARMRYYDGLFFRFIDKNLRLGLGGNYECEGSKSSGFALYTDAIIDTMIKIRK